MKILTATFPFGRTGRKPAELLEESGFDIVHNPFRRRLKAGEVGEIIKDVDAVIAGTEPYTRDIMKMAPNLKVIARVGIGLDSVDLPAARELGIKVTYTPDAPSQGVAELAMANILNLSRHILASDRSVREGAWNRLMGVLLRELTIGVVGVGRIGKRLIKLLQPYGTTILACDLKPDVAFGKEYGLTWVDKEELLTRSDIVTLHIPSNEMNYHYIDRAALAKMRTGTLLINTSRGAVADEAALTDALLQKHLGGAALDVFETEPYEGPLVKLDNVVMTAHMGASARESRYLMELGAAEDCLRVLRGETPAHDAILDELGPEN